MKDYNLVKSIDLLNNAKKTFFGFCVVSMNHNDIKKLVFLNYQILYSNISKKKKNELKNIARNLLKKINKKNTFNTLATRND